MSAPTTLSKKDFQSDQQVRWCPGCGDFAILSAVQQAFAQLGLPRERFMVVSGIGCSSRFPYYMNTYGFHSIHGRAPAVATGIKITNPELSVWIATGDGDSLSIGGNHLIHLLRRNVDLNVMLFNNRIYGLTKGQYSPTSEVGKRAKSTPYGSVDTPINPIALALGAGATFVARSVDNYGEHLKDLLIEAEAHRGTSFMEIYQNCNIFNDGAFGPLRDAKERADVTLELKHGKPLIFGASLDRGIVLRGFKPEVVTLGEGIAESDLLVHDETAPLAYAMMLAQMEAPTFPVPLGVIRRVTASTYDGAVRGQIDAIVKQRGLGKLEELLHAGHTWTVE